MVDVSWTHNYPDSQHIQHSGYLEGCSRQAIDMAIKMQNQKAGRG